jgi:16S rRNA (cytosine1402-N4)-methyltransferase
LTTSSSKDADFSHVTVLRDAVTQAVVQAATGRSDALVVDCTLGGGGHSEAILAALPNAQVIGLDRDPAAIRAATQRLAGFGERFRAVHAPFGQIHQSLKQLQVFDVTAIIADLGVSSHQFDTPERGFSIRHDGPLDMRMDTSTGLTLAERLATVTVEDLADVLYNYGDIRRSIGTARIVLQSVQEGADTTGKLAQRLAARLPRDRNVHPATLVFQALRIWVNDELEQLEALLRDAPGLLQPGGVLAVISFHSGEDRLVKQMMREQAPKKYGEFMRGKPQAAEDEEVRDNPRARSARLRLLWRRREDEQVDVTDEDEDA